MNMAEAPPADAEINLKQRPWEQRLRLRVLIGTLLMLRDELADMPIELREAVMLPPPGLIDEWKGRLSAAWEGSVDTPGSAPVRTTTTMQTQAAAP